jgi:glucose-6-phosphate 1-dehydrogenase
VFFGATGDLAYKKIFPSLQALIRRGHLDMPIVGVAKAGWNLDQLKARAQDSLEKHGGIDRDAFAKLCSRLRYIDGDYRDPETFASLRQALGNASRPVHYLAIPPSLFATVSDGLAKTGCAKDARVVVEKPFGQDLKSAQELNRTLHQFFPESAIFRIDHYLGKEPVQNITYFRFANPIIDAGFTHHRVEGVQITMAENFGVAGRGKFYEEAGAIRDVVQNHMLQVIACLAMESPERRDHEALRDERGKVMKAIRPLAPADVIRGQFTGYRKEPGVAADSKVETFAAVRFQIDSPRWSGVPFYVRAGKCLPVTTTEVFIKLKPMSHPVLDETGPPLPNYLRFRLSPAVVIALGTKVKKAGETMVGERIELISHHQPPEEMEPYERLLWDATRGDGELFARQDSVEEAWRVVDPILGNVTPVYEYQPGTWGPAEADRIGPPGGWHNPAADGSAS